MNNNKFIHLGTHDGPTTWGWQCERQTTPWRIAENYDCERQGRSRGIKSRLWRNDRGLASRRVRIMYYSLCAASTPNQSLGLTVSHQGPSTPSIHQSVQPACQPLSP